jgi:hypothetical protein
MMCPVNIKTFLAALAICCAAAGHAAAQSTAPSAPVLINGDSNEDSKAGLDLIAQDAGRDKLIIMVARLGRGESSGRLNWRRLRTARSFLEIVRGVPRQRMILASGERVPGAGQIEVYLDGKLHVVFVFARNRDFAPEG